MSKLGIDEPRLNEVTRTFNGPKQRCKRCKITYVQGKLTCDDCEDVLRETRAASEQRFLFRKNLAKYLKVHQKLMNEV